MTTPPKAATREEAVARGLLDEIAHGAWDHPKTPFSKVLAEKLPADRLRGAWTELESYVGRYYECKDATQERKGELTVVSIDCVFEKAEETFRITLDAGNAVTAFSYDHSQKFLGLRARTLIEKSNDGDFAGAARDFGAVMREKMPTDRFGAAWRALVDRVGRFQSIEEIRFQASGGGAVESIAIARFEKSKIQVKTIWDRSAKVIGLFFAPDNPWTPPPYAEPDKVVVTDVTVGNSPALPGLLTLPKGDTPVPAVVLVHGSGPGDRDEAIGGTRIFADLALGLGARGIGVLRYDKRSRVSPAGIVTEKDEVLDPAEEALVFLRAHPRVDKHRIFVIGHSQGGNLAPRIASKASDLAGYVTLAGNARPIQDVVIDQYEYFAKLHPDDEKVKKGVEAAKEFKKQVEDPALRPGDDPHAPWGGHTTGAYYLFQRGYDPVAAARALGVPILVLQGGRDYQVTMKDFDRWKAGLGAEKFATLKLYPEDTHLFTVGTGTPTPEEYDAPNHVDPRVISDIAEWIGKH